MQIVVNMAIIKKYSHLEGPNASNLFDVITTNLIEPSPNYRDKSTIGDSITVNKKIFTMSID